MSGERAEFEAALDESAALWKDKPLAIFDRIVGERDARTWAAGCIDALRAERGMRRWRGWRN